MATITNRQATNVQPVVPTIPTIPTIPIIPPGPDPNAPPITPEEIQVRADFVKAMAKKAFDSYVSLTKSTSNKKEASRGWFGKDHDRNMIASMSTLWVMELRSEFDIAQTWVEQHFNFANIQEELVVAQVITDYIGGLLSCYALTTNKMFLTKARKIAEQLEPVYRMADNSIRNNPAAPLPPTDLPYWKYDPREGNVIGAQVSLAEVATGALEYIYLSDMTGDLQLRSRVRLVRNFLSRLNKPNSLTRNQIDVEIGQFWSYKSSLFKTGRDYYYNLVKVNIQSGGVDTEALDQFKERINCVFKEGLFSSSKSGFIYARELDLQAESYEDYMDHEGCSLGAMFALASHAIQRSSPESEVHHNEEVIRLLWHMTSPITETGHQAYKISQCKLAPRRFYFTERVEARNAYYGHFYKQYLLLPELAESYFILWRLSHDRKWRDYAWELVQIIKEKCETKNGFMAIGRVDNLPLRLFNYQPVHLLSATFKYLYLIFKDDSVLPLDQWVFNTNGHPLPICGQNAMYPKERWPTQNN